MNLTGFHWHHREGPNRLELVSRCAQTLETSEVSEHILAAVVVVLAVLACPLVPYGLQTNDSRYSRPFVERHSHACFYQLGET